MTITVYLNFLIFNRFHKSFLSIRKKGFQQSLGFLTKYQFNNEKLSNISNDELLNVFMEDEFNSASKNFSLNEFFMKFPIEKFCDVVTNLTRTNRTFIQNNFSINNAQQVPIFQVSHFLT